jgi:hypothetical protein
VKNQDGQAGDGNSRLKCAPYSPQRSDGVFRSTCPSDAEELRALKLHKMAEYDERLRHSRILATRT